MLTEQERNTLNEAMAIIERNTLEGTSLMISARWTCGCDGFDFDISYFDSRKLDTALRQHSSIKGDTFADKVQAVIDIEASLPSPEAARAARAEALRKELAELENAA